MADLQKVRSAARVAISFSGPREFDSIHAATFMKHPRPFRLLPFTLALFLPALAHAHTGLGQAHGFLPGLAHPVLGLDQLCAMIAVGLWAVQRGGCARWLVPLTFVGVMALGEMLGMAAVSLPFAERGIAASVLVLGVLIAAAVRLPVAVSAAIVGMCALFHGHAHGAEMPENASGLLYGLGFTAATAGLHLGWLVQRWGSASLLRSAVGLHLFCFV